MFNNKKILNELKYTNKKIDELIKYNKNRKKILIDNLVGGIFKGLGISIGVIILGAGIMMILKDLITLPVIGKYVGEIVAYVELYLDGKK